MRRSLLSAIACLGIMCSDAQSSFQQYFDGGDTSVANSLFVSIDNTAGNVWQVGEPDKILFHSGSTVPNAIMTDTAAPYPANNISRFSTKFKVNNITPFFSTLIAVRWKQKLDMRSHKDGGVVEFSKNGGAWENLFNNPNVYNVYGFSQANKDTLPGGQYAFSGTDTLWRDIWFCLFVNPADSFTVRYSLISDTASSPVTKEGWIIDNLMVRKTIFHTVGKVENSRKSKVYPTVTKGEVFIEAEHLAGPHFIKHISITDASGKIVRKYADDQTRFIVDISDSPPGIYYINVTTNLASENFPVVLQR